MFAEKIFNLPEGATPAAILSASDSAKGIYVYNPAG
jgi:hypothetical protein